MNILPFERGAKLGELREMLRNRFPGAVIPVMNGACPSEKDVFVTGVPCIDEIGIARGTVTEIVTNSTDPSRRSAKGESRGNGGTLLLSSLLHRLGSDGQHAALIDGGDHFDPPTSTFETCRRLLWVRCTDAGESIKAADLLLRDGNLPAVVLDLQGTEERELRSISRHSWSRLCSLVEQSGTTFLAFTPSTQVPGAQLRLTLTKQLTLEALDHPRKENVATLAVHITRARSRHYPDCSEAEIAKAG